MMSLKNLLRFSIHILVESSAVKNICLFNPILGQKTCAQIAKVCLKQSDKICETIWTLAYNISFINVSCFMISDKINDEVLFNRNSIYSQYNTIKKQRM